MKKYFISCAIPGRKIGAMQFEAENEDVAKKKAKEMCPERAHFRAYEFSEFDKDMPVDEFVSADKLKELGY